MRFLLCRNDVTPNVLPPNEVPPDGIPSKEDSIAERLSEGGTTEESHRSKENQLGILILFMGFLLCRNDVQPCDFPPNDVPPDDFLRMTLYIISSDGQAK